MPCTTILQGPSICHVDIPHAVSLQSPGRSVTTTTRLCPRFCSGARLNTEQPFKFLFYAVTQVLSVKSLQFSQSSCSKYQGISDLNVHNCDILLILLDPHEDARKEASIKYIFVDRKGVVSISLRPTSHQVGHF